jgi:hypothetical protein
MLFHVEVSESTRTNALETLYRNYGRAEDDTLPPNRKPFVLLFFSLLLVGQSDSRTVGHTPSLPSFLEGLGTFEMRNLQRASTLPYSYHSYSLRAATLLV